MTFLASCHEAVSLPASPYALRLRLQGCCPSPSWAERGAELERLSFCLSFFFFFKLLNPFYLYPAATWTMQQGGQEALAGSHSREQEKRVLMCEPQSLESSMGAFSLVSGDGTAIHARKQVLSL